MKRSITVVIILSLMICVLMTACEEKSEYTPTGEFYIKTSPSNGDGGVAEVISLEADHKSYMGDGDITVPMTVGLGHLPGQGGYGDIHDTFYVMYKIIEAPWQADKEPAWEKKVEYADSWYDSKYDSTEQENHPFLFFPHYGEFYPLYKEDVEIVFPAEVEKGTLHIEIYTVIKGQEDQQFANMEFYFERANGVLTLNPHND